jgi:putative OPT family oligopeptide transporter
MASVAAGVLGGDLPWDMIIVGAGIGLVIVIVDEILKRRGSSFRAPVLAVAVGIYLPFELSVPIFLGGLIAWLVSQRKADANRTGPGVLFAAGLITGEALVGILVAIPIVATGDPAVLAMNLNLGVIAGLVALAVAAFSLWRAAGE